METKKFIKEMMIMKLFKYFKYNYAQYKNNYYSDLRFLSFFGERNGVLNKYDKGSVELKYLKLYRKFQANSKNVWGKFYRHRLKQFNIKYGLDFGNCLNFGKGIVIGHWGRIIINGDVKFGNHIMLTHNVTIGRDVRGKHKGVPTIGNNVCIRTNSTIVGNITIGDDVLIAPNTFVNFDVPSHSVVIGNPAVIHHRDNATEGHIVLYESLK